MRILLKRGVAFLKDQKNKMMERVSMTNDENYAPVESR